MVSEQTEAGLRWVAAQVYAIARELGLVLDGEPEYDREDPLNFKMAVEIGGERKILRLWGPNIDDSQGGNNPATRQVQEKLRDQITAFLATFASPEKRLEF